MILRQNSEGEWLVCKRVSSYSKRKTGKNISYRDWFLIKYHSDIHTKRGVLDIRSIVIPTELVGKKVRIKLEIL